MKAAMRFQAAITLSLLGAVSTSPALAEPGPGYTDSGGPSIPRPEGPASDEWRYGTYYLYPLTRHMAESGISQAWRCTLYPLTAVLDTAQLPLGALAGLFGD